ncbi:MAG TPA: hypothetical protein PK919_09850 [Candidatus Aminicenantes bacterium]|nr:hypothetical protein [Candidatus Aminicenantes bacterium]
MSWNLIEADGTYHWRDPVVFIAMMITLVILFLATFIWMKQTLKGKKRLWAVPLFLLYLASPWIQSALVGAYIVVYSQTYPGATMHLNYSIDWATPIDKVITFLSPPLFAFLLGLRVWMNNKGRVIK